MVKKQKKQARRAFSSLTYPEKLMRVRILHSGCLTTEEISKKLGCEERLVEEILKHLHLKPNTLRIVDDDGYHVRVDKIL